MFVKFYQFYFYTMQISSGVDHGCGDDNDSFSDFI